MVFDHVADRPSIVVELSPPFDPELLRQCDLHTLDVITIPDRLQEAGGEEKEQKIETGLFTKVVVDAKDSRFRKHRMKSGIQLLRRGEIVPEGLLDNRSSIFHAVRLCKRLDNTHKKTWRNSQIVRWAARRAERFLQQLEGLGFFIIPADIAKQVQQLGQGFLIDLAPLLLDTVAHPLFEMFVGPRGPGNANHRYIQVAMPDHMIKSRKDFLIGQVSHCSE